MTETKEAPVTRTVVLPRCGPLVGERLCTATGAKDVTLSGCSWKFCALSVICTSIWPVRGSTGV